MIGAWLPEWQGLAVSSRAFKVAALGAPALLVFGMGWLLRLQEPQQLYRQGSEALVELARAHAQKSQQMQELPTIKAALADSQAQLQDARWRLAAGEGMSDLLDQLASSGHAHGLSFERLDVLEEVQASDYWVAPLQIEVMGSYSALRMWLDEWLGQMRLLRPSGLRLEAAQGRTGVLRMRLQVQAYHAGQTLPLPLSLADEPAREATEAPRSDPFQSWSSRLAVGGLARVPLAQLEMVGSLSRAGQSQALVWSAGRIYRVKVGDPLGRDEGVVTRIDERQLEVLERVFLGGAWQHRSTYLALRKRAGKGVKDEREAAVGVGSGNDPVDSGGVSGDLRG